MKRLLLLVFVFLSVVGRGQQIDVEVGLPIGVNVDNHPAQVGIAFGSYSIQLEETFSYTPAMGTLKSVVESQIKKLADRFVPPIPETPDAYLYVTAEPGPYYIVEEFKLQQSGSRWIIPPEVLEVKLDYGGAWIFKVAGVKEIRMRLFKSEQQVGRLYVPAPSYREGYGWVYGNFEVYGFDLSGCSILVTQSALKRGEVDISSRYAVPSLWDGTWDYGEMDIVADDGSITINLLDGSVLDYSSPPPAFLKFPEPKLEIAKTADGFELSVTGVWERPFIIESTKDFVLWEPYPTADLSAVGKSGKKSFRAQGILLGASRFFRLRLGNSLPTKH